MNDNNLDFDSCSCTIIHQDIVNMVKKNLLDDDKILSLAELFKVLGDPTRVKIIYALFTSEMCVCDIAALLGASQSAISHQLRTLKQTRLIKYRREGKVVYYSLDDEHIKGIFDMGLSHVKER